MPSRYCPISQELNNDPETWELTDTFGDRSLRIWVEVLAIIDREKNTWKLVDGWETVIGRKVRQSPQTVWRVVGWMLAKGWLDAGQGLASGWPVVRQSFAGYPPTILRARNYAKYRKLAAGEMREISPPLLPILPILPNPENPKKDSLVDEPGNTTDPTAQLIKSGKPKSDLSVQDLIESWNEQLAPPLPSVLWPLSASRHRKAAMRLREHPGMDFWITVFQKVLASNFLTGKKTDWRCSIDFIIANDTNVLKICEGGYDNGQSPEDRFRQFKNRR